MTKLVIYTIAFFQINILFANNLPFFESPKDSNYHKYITDLPIEEALLYIAKKSNVELVYSKDILPKGKKVSIEHLDKNVDEALNEILSETDIDYVSLSNRKIIITSSKDNNRKGIIRGIVSDSTNGEILAFGNVLIKETNNGTSTNEKGLFIITSLYAPAEYTLQVSYVGYQTKEIVVKTLSNKVTHIDVKLLPNTIELQTVEKVGQKVPESNAIDLGLERLSIKDLEKLPQSAETDIFRLLKTVPGVKSTGDISARYYVRGSPSSHNLILLNGITIYHPFHALGMFSSVDPEMINSMEFYKSGIPVEYSGRLSSILNLVTKDGNKLKYSGTYNATMLTNKALVEGPIPNGSFILTGRKSHSTAILDKFLNEENIPLDFYDFSFKLNLRDDEFVKKSNYSIFGFVSNDKLQNNSPSQADYDWSNKLFGFKWFQLTDSPLFYEVNFFISSFEAETIPNFSSVLAKDNDITDITAKVDVTYVYDNKNQLDVGLKIKEVKSSLVLENSKGNSGDISGPKGANISAYLNYKFLSNKDFGLDIGSRVNLTRIAAGTAGQYFFEPRINFTGRFSPATAIKASWGIHNQELITLSDEDELINIFEPWFVTPNYLDPSQAIHYSAGLSINPTGNIEIDIEGYYKEINNFAALNDNKLFDTDPDLVNGEGESKGLELQINYTPKPYRINLGYSISEATKKVNGIKYPPRYDSRHTVNFSFEYNIGDGWYTSVVWTYNSGMPFTQFVGFRERLYIDDFVTDQMLLGNYDLYYIFGERNAVRLPDYHRLDFSLSKFLKIESLKIHMDLSLINVYDRKNIFYFDRETGKRINMLPFLPTASIKIEI